MLSFDACYAAMARRDPAIDGLFFVAVRTTKIYCRPVCRARIPLAKNVCLYPSAAAAECGFDSGTHVTAMIYLGWPIGEAAVPERPPVEVAFLS